MELLISFGTSKGGSAGHIALDIRNQAAGYDTVYSANFYADRTPEHAKGFYNDDLMIAVPKKEYLFKTTSSLVDTASFGLDFGEIYKRSMVGIRVYNVPTGEKEALITFFKRINEDYHNHVGRTEYHRGNVIYGTIWISIARRPSARRSGTAPDISTSKWRADPFSPNEKSRRPSMRTFLLRWR